jgi:hypothetical protein
MRTKTRNPLRCVCSRRPLLGIYGLDEEGKRYIHIKAYKQDRIIAEVVAYGTCEIHCRECLRWFRFNFTGVSLPFVPPVLTEINPPDMQTLGDMKRGSLT